MDLPATGGCRCGTLRFEITAPPILSAACHCRGCQRMAGGAFSLSLAIPPEGFRVIEGETVPCGADHAFGHEGCPECLSWVFTRPPQAPFVNVRTTMLDVTMAEPPIVEVQTTEALPWAIIGARFSSTAFPEMEEWAVIAEAYAKR